MDKSMPIPKGPCRRCPKDAVEKGEFYCKHNSAGGILLTTHGLTYWLMYSGVTRFDWQSIRSVMFGSKISVVLPPYDEGKENNVIH